MISTSRSRTLAGLGLVLAALASCTAEDNAATSVAPSTPTQGGGGGGTSGATLSGTVLVCDAPLAGVKVSSVDAAGGLLGDVAETTSDGRWLLTGLPAGATRLRFQPPTPDPLVPNSELRVTFVPGVEAVDGVETVVRPLFMVPVRPGGFIVTDNSLQVQTFNFRVDPLDLGSAVVPGLEQAEVTFRPTVRFTQEGLDLIQLGIDDDTGTPGRQLLVEVAVLNSYELPQPVFDVEGNVLNSTAFHSFYPQAIEMSRGMEVDLPNFDGFEPSREMDVRLLSAKDGASVSAGEGRVDGFGDQALQVNGDGALELGVYVPVPEPTPTTDVTGQVRRGGLPLTRAGIAVVTNAGLFGVTDENGIFFIDDVPIPYNEFDLECIVVSDRGSEFEIVRASTTPTYPTTTLDIDIAGIELATPDCDLANSEPLEGATGVRTNDPVRIRFTTAMEPLTLESAITMTATTATGGTVDVLGTVASREVLGGGGERLTEAFFLSDDPLPVNASIVVTVAETATDVAGNALAAPCTLSFQTGTSTLALPQVYFITPEEGTVESTVTIRGVNLDFASNVFFDGAVVSPDVQTANEIQFVVPLSEGAEAPGPRTVQVDPGGLMETFTILPRIDLVQIDSDPDPGIETLVDAGIGTLGTSVGGVDQNDGTLVIISGQNLFDPVGMAPPVVTFGRGDGVVDAVADGDAALDGPDEAATAQRIDVNVPPTASTGDLRVLVDFGGAAPLTSTFARFATQLRSDSDDPTVDVPSLIPAPGSVGVASTTTITVRTDEIVAGNSRLLVGTGVPLRIVPGTTRVTTSTDGTQGIMEFIPEAGALPTNETVFVQAAAASVEDPHGNSVVSFDFTFDTGATAPGAGPTDDDGRVLPGVLLPDATPLGGGVVSKAPGSDVDLVSGVAVGGASLAQPSEPDAAAFEIVPVVESTEIVGFAGLSLIDGTTADWGERPADVRWDGGAIWLANDALAGAPATWLRFDLAEGRARDRVLRFAIETGEGEAPLTGLIADLDDDGRHELHLFGGASDAGSTPEAGARELFRPDLVQVGEGFVEAALPALEAVPGQVFKFRLESFDLRRMAVDASPEVILEPAR